MKPAILSAFKRIKSLARKVERAEYEWVRKVTKEIEKGTLFSLSQ